jgi:hypothetical protein
MSEESNILIPDGPKERECGFRVEQGIYACVPTSPNGRPLEDFFVDPPVWAFDGEPIEDALDLKPLGVRIIGRKQNCGRCRGTGQIPNIVFDGVMPIDVQGDKPCDGCEGTGRRVVHHIYDWVGEDHYPNVLDVAEEGRRRGFSRRCELPSADDYAKLDSESRLLLVHSRAWIDNSEEYFTHMGLDMRSTAYGQMWRCPKYIHEHHMALVSAEGEYPKMCCGLYWYDLQEGTSELLADDRMPAAMRNAPVDLARKRELVSGTYYGFERPEEIEPEYRPAIFLSLPIVTFQIVDPKREAKDQAAKLSRCGLPVEVTDF